MPLLLSSGTLVWPSHRVLCPSCFERFSLATSPIVSTVGPAGPTASIQGAVEAAPVGWQRLLAQVWVKRLVGPPYDQVLARRSCPVNGCLLPPDIEMMDNIVVGMVGGGASGKSHYIAALIDMIGRQAVLDSLGCAAFLPMDDDTRDRYERDYRVPLFDERRPIDFTQRATSSARVKPLVYTSVFEGPGASSRQRRVNLSLFDAAGEQMLHEQEVAVHLRYIANASGLIFMVDPLTIKPIAEGLRPHLRPLVQTSPDPFQVLHQVYETCRRQQGRRPGDRVDVPIAITIAKADLLRWTTATRGMRLGFLEPRSQTEALDAGEIRATSQEVEELLRRFASPALVQIAQRFSRVSYHAVSATGGPPDRTGQFPVVAPWRCVTPLFWLLQEAGIAGPARTSPNVSPAPAPATAGGGGL